MIKKSSTSEQKTARHRAEAAPGRKKRLEIKQIRSFVEKLQALPDGAPMPDWSDISIGDRFAIAYRLIPQDDRDRVLGRSAAHAKRYEQGTDIPISVVARLAIETEIPVDWIVTGKAMARLAPLIYVVPGNHDIVADIPVQRLAFKVAAGRGEMILDESADYMRVPETILKGSGVAPQNARLMEARGESMRNTINDGDLMLVDISPAATEIVEGMIYVFAIDNEAYVKRLKRTGRKVTMISDNREMFPPEDIPESATMRVFGRVKWSGRYH